MNIIKLPLATLAVWMSVVPDWTFAEQSVHEKIPVKEGQTIRIDIKLGDEIILIPVKGNTLQVDGTYSVNDGENDDAYEVKVISSPDLIEVRSTFLEEKHPYRMVQELDKNGKVISSRRDVEIEASFRVEVPETSPVTIKTINADLNLLEIHAPMEAETINGEIQLLLNKRSNIDLDVSTINGDCFTDLDFTGNNSGKSIYQPHAHLHYRLNEGGNSIRLKTINGTMYLLNDSTH